ncbi:MAG: hypothetical protein ACE37K_09500 [Planctomycetota bacterium]|jgi:uncharacterized protein YegP (UPF0339 family)
MANRFEVVLEHDDTFLFQLRTKDGDVVLRGLGSPSKIMTQNEILHLRNSLRDDARRVPHESADGEHFLVIKDRDGSVLAKSPRVASKEALEGLEQRILDACGAPIVDLTKRSRSAAG